MKRNALNELISWKNSRKRKPLVIMGARQVGKTWLMEEFAKQEFGDDYVLVNFMRKRSLCQQLKTVDNEKFSYAGVKHGARAREYEAALEWLNDAGMIYRLYRVCPPGLPLSRYVDTNAFKVFAFDVGLLGAMSSLDPAVVLEKNALFTHFKGALTEQFILQELKTLGIESGYWTPEAGISEVDFVLQGRQAVYPLEVKSATNTKAKSLGVYMTAYQPKFAVKSSLKNFSVSRSVRSLPLYAAYGWIKQWIDE